ncbi:MAG TPA: NADH-quinone oxidoreductase subunit L [Bacteroidia bacterium]|nr:NADH-quinone oxidoreductase subunit L [Bacteroidia bacterium]
MIQLAWLIPVLPLLGFIIIGLAGKKLSKALVSAIGCGSVLLSFGLAVGVFLELKGTVQTVHVFDWITAGSMQLGFDLLIDPLSALFLLIITGIGFLIHVYSTGYMHDDEGYGRYFSYLNLFVFFMLLLVMGGNYVLMFVGWEGVGLCSYLLIGFWFKKEEYNNAAKKAFIVNRIGDLAFLVGIIMIYMNYGSLTYSEVFAKAENNTTLFNAIGILLFIGACGKSAQIPLYTWLPDAMAGPTPVSALIHAATMVTSGIYMITRSAIFYAPHSAEIAANVVAIVGVMTALFAATIGLFQTDIKKVLAYSTVSQLGLMFLGLGVGAFTGGVFHVMTHAFFKALLFLCAGSVIHAMSGEQDIRKMGGLKKSLPITHLTFLIGTLAISGLPPFSGFFSKDEILAHAFEHNKLYWLLGIIASMMTAFYMFRLYFLTFHGSFRGTQHQKDHLHESPKSMTIPLVILAVFAIGAGFIGLPDKKLHFLDSFLQNTYKFGHANRWIDAQKDFHSSEAYLMAAAVGLALVSIFLAWSLYKKRGVVPVDNESEMGKPQRVIYNKYYVDEIYDAIIRKPLDKISEATYRFFEIKVVDAFVNGVGNMTRRAGEGIKYMQAGTLGFYVFAMTIAVILIFIIKVF